MLGYLNKSFELIHSEMCADDLIVRIREILGEHTEPIFDCFLDYQKYVTGVIAQVPGFLAKLKSTIKKWSNAQLLSILRVFALRGEYLNRIEKMNNKLRNLLSDFDEASIDLEDYFGRANQPNNSKELLSAVSKILEILFKFKADFFEAVKSRKFGKFTSLSLKTAFKSYK